MFLELFYKMNSEREEPSKADLVRMVNQFLLQNGLPVTAAALQKECEKLLGKNKASNDGGRRTAREGAAKAEGGQGGGRQIAGKCLADWLHRKEQQERRMPSPNEQKEQKSPPPPPRPSPPTDQSQQQHLGPISPRKMPSMLPSNSSRNKEGGGEGSQSTRNPRRRQMLPPNGKSGGNSQSARIAGGRTSHRTNSQQRGGEKSTAGTDTEDGGGRATPFSVFIAAKEQHQMRNKGGGGGKLLLRKAESMGSILPTTTTAPSSIPPDPVQARPGPMEKNGAEESAAIGEEELAENRWLSAHLDLGIVGQTLLRAGSAPGREIALLVQAIRHQLTKIGTLADGEANLRVFAAKDLLQLRNRKQSLASLLLADQSAIPEFKEQFTRLLNAFASFRAGRDYLLSVGQGRQLLYETTMALKGRRLVGHSVEQLLAALQKLSIRPAAQKELLLNGMLEWLALQLVQPKLSAAQLEFGTALLHNLAVNHQMAQSGLLRHKDQLLAAMYWLLGSSRNAQVLNNICGTLYILLGHGRIRQSARERGDLERAICDRMQREQQQQQRPEHQRQLLALSQILRGELAPERRKPSASNDDNQDSFPDYLEAEIDSTDPLVPSLSEHFGQALLAQKFLLPDATFPPRRLQHIQYAAIEEDQESVPGVVPVPHQRSRPPPPHNQPNSHQSRPPPKAGLNPRQQQNFTSPQRKYRLGAKENGPGAGNGSGSKSAPSKDIGSNLFLGRQVHFERTSSMSSHSTFVVENNCRRPLLATNGFASVVASLKTNSASILGSHRTAAAAGAQQRKRAGETATEKLESNSSSEALTIEENAVEKQAEEIGKKAPLECANRLPVGIGMPEVVQKLAQRQNRQQTTTIGEGGIAKRQPAEIAKMFSSKLRTQREKWPRRESSNLLMTTPSPTMGREEAAKEEELARSATFGGTSERENEGGGEVVEQTYDEYIAIFAARPKLNRTPPEFDE